MLNKKTLIQRVTKTIYLILRKKLFKKMAKTIRIISIEYINYARLVRQATKDMDALGRALRQISELKKNDNKIPTLP